MPTTATRIPSRGGRRHAEAALGGVSRRGRRQGLGRRQLHVVLPRMQAVRHRPQRHQPPRVQARPGHGGGPVGSDHEAGDRGDRRGRQGPPVRRHLALLAVHIRRDHGGHEAERLAALPCPCLRALRRRGRQMRLRRPQDRRRQASPRGRGRAQRGLRVPEAPPHVRRHAHRGQKAQTEAVGGGSAGDIAAAIARPRDQAFSTPHEPNAAIAQKVADYKAAPL